MHLSDCFLELFTFIRYLTEAEEMVDADYDTVRRDVALLVERQKTRAHAAGISEDRYEKACFAVIAWVDETVLCSSWKGARAWLKQPLQRELYGTVNAGEEFFEQLDALLGAKRNGDEGLPFPGGFPQEPSELSDPQASEILEVYALCLTLGYTGRYFSDNDRERLGRLRGDSVSRILGEQIEGRPVFPESYGSGGPKKSPGRYFRRVFDPLALMFVVFPLLVVTGIFFAYHSLLAYSLTLWFG